MERSDMIMAAPTNAKSLGMIESSNETSGAGRVSDTNVQVVGIDEPDIIKTDGTNLFFSSEIRRYPNAFEEGIYSKPPAVPYPTALT
ncbi:beta-propeller domain-containing protein, partial [Patescibacteria group bacterium]|nr:beta-propeller domain-containing protein [Patescibacteria group bacterium]